MLPQIRNSCLLLLLTIGILVAKSTKADDSIPTLNFSTYLGLVKKYHPIIRQAKIGIEQSEANQLVVKGNFDPILNSGNQIKSFDGVNYYNDISAEIIVPTWYAVDIVAGVENVSGVRNPTDVTLGRTSYFGLSVPLLKGLLIDKRRAATAQAKILNSASFIEQKLYINNLLYQSVEAYYNWISTFQVFDTYNKIITINEKRIELTKKAYNYGERAALDTVEAITQLQSFQYLRNQALIAYNNATIELNTYLWTEQKDLAQLPATISPNIAWEKEINLNSLKLVLTDLLNQAETTHPELKLYDFKLDGLAIDQKLKKQELLPKLDFKYNQLGKGFNLLKTATTGPLFDNNFKYGIKFQMPLRLSAGRGEYKLAKLKIEEAKLDRLQKQIAIRAKVSSYFNEFLVLKNQVELLNATYNNQQRLLTGEETRYFNGESSLFLINSRENKVLETLEKLIITKTKLYKTYYSIRWAAGILE